MFSIPKVKKDLGIEEKLNPFRLSVGRDEMPPNFKRLLTFILYPYFIMGFGWALLWLIYTVKRQKLWLFFLNIS
jgi:hypothetical protein